MRRTAPTRRSLPDIALSAAFGAATGALLLLSACASTPPPNEQLAVGQAAVEHANSTAAADSPMLLAAARNKIARADAARTAGDHVLARELAEQAEADATLADAQARALRSQRALAEVREGLRQLREEAGRK
ncbi:DUF4398 domain-containing protein [Aquincola sp. S2]|uniref:DUF4398 domain-containing protein n=1 Tax=Pseudaquabacterium terrae TaxID=2732868 RepID=A0ABX2EEU1_9BURK|nr:DUF4398 domain-containing protein [Aquabacterium terrae]NRF67117.1 DUF4398 domain-containing protein [Aquabacterium terrae]